jgi:hypothetical protein
MENSPSLDRAWSNISSTTAPPQLLYLDTLRASDFGQFYKRQSFDLLEVQAVHHVLEVGCGPADDVHALAERRVQSFTSQAWTRTKRRFMGRANVVWGGWSQMSNRADQNKLILKRIVDIFNTGDLSDVDLIFSPHISIIRGRLG